MNRKLPPCASVAKQGDGARLVAPAADRNAQALCDLLQQVAPQHGQALELASGTGQHVIRFATALPHLHWQPTEIDASRRASIDAYARGLTNVRPALDLNATATGWGARQTGQDLIVLINLLHLISLPETATLITQTAQALASKGRFVIYGPFMRSGALTSTGDARFHAALIEQDAQIGYKDDFEIMDLLRDAGLNLVQVIEMPANNLALIAEKPDR